MGFLILRAFWQFVKSKNDKRYFKIVCSKYDIFRDDKWSVSDVTATVVEAREASSLSLGHKQPSTESPV